MAVGQPGQHLEGGAGDGPRALGGDVGRGERLAGQALVLGLDVDRGQHPVGAHPAQQPQARDAGAGADLDHRAGFEHRGQEAQSGASARADRHDADLVGVGACGGQDVVLGHVGIGVGPARGIDRIGHGAKVSPSILIAREAEREQSWEVVRLIHT